MVKDILIVGCGPSGMYGWKIAADLNLTGTVVDGREQYGGQVTASYPEKYIYNFPAIEKIQGQQAMDQMFNCIKKDNNFELWLETKIINIEQVEPETQEDKERLQKWFKVHFSNDQQITYKKILFTDGLGLYKPMKLVEQDYENIIYTVKNISSFKDKKTLIFGGGDSALDWANELKPYTHDITIIHRRNDFRAKPASIDLAKENGINFLTPYTFDSILEQDNNIAKKIKLIHSKTNEQLVLEFDKIIVQFGQTIQKISFDHLKLETNKLNKFIVDNNTMITNVEGIYAAGDCCTYESKVRNIVAGMYEAMIAVINIDKSINNKKILNNGW